VRLDEVVPGDNRTAGAACAHVWRRVARRPPARTGARPRMGSDRRGSRPVDRRRDLCRHVDGDLPSRETERRAPPAVAGGGSRVRGRRPRGMNVLIVSGIWPPDVGGPASHAPEVASFLRERGHDVEVVITADRAPAAEAYPVHWVSRALPKGVVHARALATITAQARTSDVVYATGMFARTAAACTLTRTPSVVKLTGDPAFERMRWRGTITGGLEEFQRGGGGIESAALRALRSGTLRAATRIVCPSA